ncbi:MULTISPECIES: hypothetical protein [Mycobacterium]|uniref:hypothetical protein n=1 Tax=Mycobacterium TaxID=1763 RepID=UPI0013F4EE02|nr:MULTISPECIES: hypothetical protein [Mycobacterium]MCG7611333.1 hypothetical protein [Mycobacterium sp. CnD-18-1]
MAAPTAVAMARVRGRRENILLTPSFDLSIPNVNMMASFLEILAIFFTFGVTSDPRA